jgi:uncharacterized membrane protein HdeD (DUF308 family)
MSGEIETRRRAVAFMGNLTAVLGLLILGFPLTPATIRTTLVGWFLMAVAVMQFIVGRFQTTGSSITSRSVPLRSTDCGRYQEGSYE